MTDTQGARPPRWMLPAQVALVVVLVAALLTAYLLHRSTSSYDQRNADQRQAVAVAEQFALRMDDFGAKDVNAYESAIQQLLTTKGKASFNQVKQLIGASFQAAHPTKAGQAAPSGSIVYSGVQSIDAYTATVLVAHDATVPVAAKKVHFRWTITLQKIGGQWLVDGLPPDVMGGGSQ